jgi:hypothetical protein
MDPRLSWFAMGAVFGLVLCGWPWHPRFSRYSCRRITTCGGGEITRAEWEAMRTPPQFPPGRIIGPDGTTIGYRSINYPDPSPDRRPTNPFNGERTPNPPPREP